MPRLAPLLAALALVAGCDSTPAPEPFNPYDANFDGARIPTGPSALALEAATATSVTLRWDDRSSFEAGYAVSGVPDPDAPFGPPLPPVELPPDATSFTADGLIGTGPLALSVRALRAPGVAVGDPVAITVRYPGATTLEVPDGEGGLLVPAADVVYRADPGGATSIGIYALAPDGDGMADRVGEVTGYDRPVGRLVDGGVVVERVLEGAAFRDVAVLRDGAAVSTTLLRSPEGPFVGGGVVAPDGSRIAVRYASGGATRIGAWDPATGAFLGGAPDPSAGALAGLRMVTAAGTVVLDDGQGDVVAVRLGDGAEVWRERAVPIAFRVAVDPAAGRVAVAEAGRLTRVIAADDGATVATVALASVGGPMLLDGETLVTNDGPVAVVRALPSGAVVRAFRGPSQITSGAVVGGALLAFDGREALGRLFRLDLGAVWEAVPSGGQ